MASRVGNDDLPPDPPCKDLLLHLTRIERDPGKGRTFLRLATDESYERDNLPLRPNQILYIGSHRPVPSCLRGHTRFDISRGVLLPLWGRVDERGVYLDDYALSLSYGTRVVMDRILPLYVLRPAQTVGFGSATGHPLSSLDCCLFSPESGCSSWHITATHGFFFVLPTLAVRGSPYGAARPLQHDDRLPTEIIEAPSPPRQWRWKPDGVNRGPYEH